MNTSAIELPSDATAASRAAALADYRILDTGPEEVFDDLARLASAICGTPMSLISLLDGRRQWFKSAHGMTLRETPIEDSFCAHAVADPGRVLVVEDASRDERFRDSPLVTIPGGIRAYAGAPLMTPHGVPLGTLCAIDDAPRSFTPEQRAALQTLAHQVITQLELRRRVAELEVNQRRLQTLNEQLDQFAYIVSHDLKAPIRHQTSFARLMLEDYGEDLDDDQRGYLQRIIDSGSAAEHIITDLNEYVHTVQTGYGPCTDISLPAVISQVISLVEPPPHLTVKVEVGKVDRVCSNSTALRHILFNLVSNAVKFHDKPTGGEVRIEAEESTETLTIAVTDDGPGITKSDHGRIFDLFRRGEGAEAVPGRGVGLAIAAKLTRDLGGELELHSAVGQGATFTVRLPGA